jgi:heme A synthase
MPIVIDNKESRMMRIRVRGMVILLALQYVAGMTLNMFGAEDIRKGSLFQKGLLFSHTLFALLLLTGSLFILVSTRKSGNEILSKKAFHGFITILVAIIAGIATLLLKDTAAEIASLIMAISFLGAFWFYAYLFFLLRKEK